METQMSQLRRSVSDSKKLETTASKVATSSRFSWWFTSSNEASTYNYQKYAGSQYFLFGGRLLGLKPANMYRFFVLLVEIIIIIIPLPVYIVFEASYTWNVISPALIFIFCYLWCLTMASFVRAAFQDPGFLPKNVHMVDNVTYNGIPWEYYSPAVVDGPSSKIELKYCTACFIWRPIRSSHCSRCNACIYNMDHHCVWLSNCVGQRNYWHFLNFLIFTVLLCAFVCAQTGYRISRQPVSETPMSLFLLIYAAICSLYPALLLFYHLCLGITGITTREYLNTDKTENRCFLQDVCRNPFNSGNWARNWTRQWFRPRGLSTLPLRQPYTPTDTRFHQVVIGSLT